MLLVIVDQFQQPLPTARFFYNIIVNTKNILKNLGQTNLYITLDEAISQLAKQAQSTVPSQENIKINLQSFTKLKGFLVAMVNIWRHETLKKYYQNLNFIDRTKSKVAEWEQLSSYVLFLSTWRQTEQFPLLNMYTCPKGCKSQAHDSGCETTISIYTFLL